MDIFEKATKAKIRFNLTKGVLTTEDLWSLKLEDLDIIAKGLNKELKASEEESFIAKKTTACATTELKFEVVKRIITVKLEEKEAKAKAAERLAKRQQLITIISEKEDSALKDKSIEELKAMLAED